MSEPKWISFELAGTKTKTFVGGYTLGPKGEGIRIAFAKKPSAWHRFWMKVALDITWDDKIESIEVLDWPSPQKAVK